MSDFCRGWASPAGFVLTIMVGLVVAMAIAGYLDWKNSRRV